MSASASAMSDSTTASLALLSSAAAATGVRRVRGGEGRDDAVAVCVSRSAEAQRERRRATAVSVREVRARARKRDSGGLCPPADTKKGEEGAGVGTGGARGQSVEKEGKSCETKCPRGGLWRVMGAPPSSEGSEAVFREMEAVNSRNSFS
jgi:hypothetical protein